MIYKITYFIPKLIIHYYNNCKYKILPILYTVVCQYENENRIDKHTFHSNVKL